MIASRRFNISWSDMPLDGLDISCLDKGAIEYFRKKASVKKIISEESLDVPDDDLLVKLKLMSPEGVLTRAAILLFHPNPEDIIRGSSVKVGMFEGTDSPEILYQDFIGGPLISMPDRLYDLINTKYSKRRISYDGLNMVETPPYPDKSLREAILNAVMHNDYGSGISIQIRIWENRMRIADSGGIPYDWSVENLFKDHGSVPNNPNLAYTFFLAGFVEGWGRGIQRIMDGYSEYPDLAPSFEVSRYSFTVVLKNINYREGVEDVPVPSGTGSKTMGLLRFLDHPDGRRSREIAEFLGIGHSNIVSRRVKPLIEQGLVERTIPDSVSSRNQRYRTTAKGRGFKDNE